jgi:hypothetical protein
VRICVLVQGAEKIDIKLCGRAGKDLKMCSMSLRY